MKSIAVFCGSSKGANPVYAEKARELGKVFAQKHIRLVYGAGKVGLMGEMADAVLAHGGEVLGVIPDFLKRKEVMHENLTELVVTSSMHTRKAHMDEACDAVIMMPGGFGTLDEFFEMLTWKQLHLHAKPIGIWNVNGYYDFLLQHIHKMVAEGFVRDINLRLFVVAEDLLTLLDKMKNTTFQKVGKWVDMNLEDPR
ncbi:MAG: TIGR00730 family Rossman fold protein [Bacteroidetes bacterium]|nr:MAG: TIGR00730 family Rossman fold protein [Bacteroidota bacterium]